MRRGGRRLAIAGLWWIAAAGPAAADVAVHDPWIAETPPGAMAAAAFMTLMNHGDEPLTIVGAESPACERIEFHRTEMDGDVARMRKQDTLPILPGGHVTLEPGGAHMMLIHPIPLHAGDRVLIRLELADGEKLAVEAEVRARGHTGGHAH